eukprot:CAMPEP_0181436074 /NCGR_PEP_ID=MMETSP1110-20121109/20660_1 /TAXON_ID=174948 /ORGANISM="Symbiodinium sp., Strain CCMP421" /LENGTH=405 /DNA_ID=CAMNT_0023559627 /DNA_START=92 /DNA_END=1309 /DNA_ORIENTATION=-
MAAARLFLILLPAAAGVCLPFEAHCCHIRSSDPDYEHFKADPSSQVPGWETVDLDAAPAERWRALVTPAADQIRTMITHFKSVLGAVSKELFKLIEDSAKFKVIAERVLTEMGEYGVEIRGIANATGIPQEEVLFYNMAYELEGGCTSIVAQDSKGRLIHGRNLDFGLLFGFDWRRIQWTLTEDLRPLLRSIRFVRRGKTVYSSTVFLGYVGTLTAVKQGAFSVSVNTRFDKSHWSALRAFLEGKGSGSFLSMLLRDVMVSNSSFPEALSTMRSAKLLGPAYVILGGTGRGEGAVLERAATSVVNETLLSEVAKQGVNSIVQTNWDYNQDPWYDNRRSPAEHCLAERFNEEVDFKGLFSVLSARPNRNRLSTHTSLMSAETGEMEAYFQYCKEFECALWMDQVVV